MAPTIYAICNFGESAAHTAAPKKQVARTRCDVRIDLKVFFRLGQLCALSSGRLLRSGSHLSTRRKVSSTPASISKQLWPRVGNTLVSRV